MSAQLQFGTRRVHTVVMAICSECDQEFSREDNMLRHQQKFHPYLFDDKEDEEEDMDEDREDEEGVEEEEGEDESESGSEAESEAEDEESEDEGLEERDDEEIYNLWAYLKKVAEQNPEIHQKYEDTVQKLSGGEMTDEEVADAAHRVIRPDILKHIGNHYGDLLKIWHFASKDKNHRKVMKSKRKLMEEEEFDPCEAIEHAVRKRKYVIHKATGLLDDDLTSRVPAPDIEEEEEEEEED